MNVAYLQERISELERELAASQESLRQEREAYAETKGKYEVHNAAADRLADQWAQERTARERAERERDEYREACAVLQRENLDQIDETALRVQAEERATQAEARARDADRLYEWADALARYNEEGKGDAMMAVVTEMINFNTRRAAIAASNEAQGEGREG